MSDAAFVADPGPPPMRIGEAMLALGDSIAAGIGASHASEGCMALLAGRLRRAVPSLRLVNLAVPGESSDSMLRAHGQLDRAERAIAEVAAAGQRIGPLTVSIGGNDAMEAALHGDDEALRRLTVNLGVILDRLGHALAATGTRLHDVAFLQTVYNPFEEQTGEVADALAPRRAARGGFNSVIRSAAARAGCRVADVAAAFRGRTAELTWVRSGDIHPSAAGHDVIAETYVASAGWDL